MQHRSKDYYAGLRLSTIEALADMRSRRALEPFDLQDIAEIREELKRRKLALTFEISKINAIEDLIIENIKHSRKTKGNKNED